MQLGGLLLAVVQCTMRLAPFKWYREGLAIKYGHSFRYHYDALTAKTGNETIRVELANEVDRWMLKIGPVPANAMVLVFTEGRMVQCSGVQVEEYIQVWQNSKIYLLAHPAITNELRQLRRELEWQKRTKREFIKLAHALATPDWALIFTRVDSKDALWEREGKKLMQIGWAMAFIAITISLPFLGPLLPPSTYQACNAKGECQLVEATSKEHAFLHLKDLIDDLVIEKVSLVEGYIEYLIVAIWTFTFLKSLS